MMAETCVCGQGGPRELPLLGGDATRQVACDCGAVLLETPAKQACGWSLWGGALGRSELGPSSRLLSRLV